MTKKKNGNKATVTVYGKGMPILESGLEAFNEKNGEAKPHEIRGASLKDDFCNYIIKINESDIPVIGLGEHNVKGIGLVDHDMHMAFNRLKVHMAFLDDAFKRSGIAVTNIDNVRDEDLTDLYTMTGFKMHGTEENESVILSGNKYLSTLGTRMPIDIPKTALDKLSPYPFWNELKADVTACQCEVELYIDGKYTLPHKDEEKPDKKQLKITDQLDEENDFLAAEK